MRKIIKIFLVIFAITAALAASFFAYFFMGKAVVKNNITWGVDFSQMQAEILGLDWKETYSAIIDDLGVKNIKLHTQWDWVEGEKDDYYFDDIDWQIKQAENKGVKIIYVVGIKSGRWPECHAPSWALSLPDSQQQQEVLEYIQKVVLRYKDSSTIFYWQVENEPLFKFGECPLWYYDGGKFLKKEVELVKFLDPSRPVIISDSGEQSSWLKAAKIGDIVGTTIYRKVWARITGKWGFNIDSFLPAVTYWRKAQLVKKFFGKDVIGVELQAEPWGSKLLYDTPPEEQAKTMNLEIFKDNIEYAKRTGLDKFYFWGVEWWYWMKTKQNQPQIWEEARKLF